MRIVIDLQSLQTDSRFRGIGRYSLALAKALLRQGAENEYWILLNDHDQKSVAYVREALAGLVDEGRILVFSAPDNINEAYEKNQWRTAAAEVIRSGFLSGLAPDVVLTTSLCEFDAIASIEAPAARSYAAAVILYDLIPLAEPEIYLENPQVRRWYHRKMASLRNADVLLAISEHSRRDAIQRLGLDEGKCKAILSAANSLLVDVAASGLASDPASIAGLPADSVLYAGGFDRRKNVDKLIDAYARLPDAARKRHPLVLAGKVENTYEQQKIRRAQSIGMAPGEIRFTGFVSDEQLVALYKSCRLFVFPSSSEGFGLPPLEAMCCGAAVIAAGNSSLVEVVGLKEALFDPDDASSFTKLLLAGLTDDPFRERLIANGASQAAKFSWESTARKTLEAISLIDGHSSRGSVPRKPPSMEADAIERIGDIQLDTLPDRADLVSVSKSMARNAETLRGLMAKNDHDAAGSNSMDSSAGSAFSDNVPDFAGLPAPYAFSSTLCRAHHFRMPLYTYWCEALREIPRFHRKQWEFVFICQSLLERGLLAPGKRAIGFGVGKEPLVSLFASRGVGVLASDLDIENARRLGWVSTNQHSDNRGELNKLGICEQSAFDRLVTFRNIDMNAIPGDVGFFDFCWSSCAFEHLGSIRRGLDFVMNSVRLLNPGGIAVHTTEFNVNSNDRTLDNNESFVIFRRRDIEALIAELSAEGFAVETVDYSPGADPLEQYVDLPPYQENLHLRLQLAGEFVSTSIGLIIQRLR